ncbi:YceK/YidQ family lipoprotein [bacterium]|jgi:hypothetical protein|nr:YceK/YidQ family lipoprotein [bacterium]
MLFFSISIAFIGLAANVNPMKKRTHRSHLVLAVLPGPLTSCATLLIRDGIGSDDSIRTEREFYPASKGDLEIIHSVGLKGEPLITSWGNEDLEKPRSIWTIPHRILWITGGLIDLPISITTDTIFLPFDLFTPFQKEGSVTTDQAGR